MKIGIVYPFSEITTERVEVFDALTHVIYETARRLAQQHEVVVYPRWQKGQPVDEDLDGFHVHRVDDRLDRRLANFRLTRLLGFKHFSAQWNPFGATSLFYNHFARQVAVDMARRGIEIAHVHCVETLLPLLRRRLPRTKLILHCHDHALADHASAPVKSMVEQADLVLTCSEFVRQQLIGEYPDLGERVATFYNGVDQAFLDVTSRPGESSTVSFVGRMTPEKGVHVLIDAFERVAPSEPSAQLELVGPFHLGTRPFVDPHGVDPVLGETVEYIKNPQDYIQHIENKAEQNEQIRYCGPIQNAELPAHYARLAVFAFPSLWHEPFGLPVIEAMAAGIPVVASQGGAIPETVEDGMSGLLVPRGDAEALGAALDRLLQNPELRQQMGETGRRRVHELFTWDRQVERLSQLYSDLLGKREPARQAG